MKAIIFLEGYKNPEKSTLEYSPQTVQTIRDWIIQRCRELLKLELLDAFFRSEYPQFDKFKKDFAMYEQLLEIVCSKGFEHRFPAVNQYADKLNLGIAVYILDLPH